MSAARAPVIGWLEQPFVKWLLPVPMLAAVFPLIYVFFRGSWRLLENDALAMRQRLAAEGRVDYRPLYTLTMGAVILAMHEYYGQVSFFSDVLRPLIARVAHADRHPALASHLALYAELDRRLWWGLTRIGGYLLPFVAWRFLFPRDPVRDMGLRFAGFRQHAWLYALFVVVMVPILLIVSRQPDFGAYYPMCATAGRSWLEFALWELVYLSQFVALEMFFRGWWIHTTRIFGTGAIFSMMVPYAMIHFGKPYLEACSALIAGAVLGSLAIRTRSIWAGAAVHGTVAILMDILSLERKGQLPSLLTAGSQTRVTFQGWRVLIWGAWGLALIVLVMRGVRMWPKASMAWSDFRARRRH
jgi:membrane protease YdiL (CAAX protease family)